MIAGFRTTLRRDAANDYLRTHQRIPESVADVMLEEGLVSWRIWIDGSTVFHMIETRDGLEELFRRLAARGSIDAEWDAVLHELVDDDPDSSAILPLVWGMDRSRQWHLADCDPAS
ncbi:MAG TPA: L-rhamnose mutarotase [Pseudolysinimonas sp.]|nr:L-rhamnose mutarotase [Pseudolysinimonas sp.]